MSKKGNIALRKKRSTRKSYAIIVDGETEKWYLELLKKHKKLLLANIVLKPEIPKRKSFTQTYDFVIEKSKEDYDIVFWLIDLDVILKQIKENSKFKKKFKDCIKMVKSHKNIKIIVNNPCLEFWFLLHFRYTDRKFLNCKDIEKELKKYLKDYQKTETYFKKSKNDIYTRLKPYLPKATNNSKKLGKFSLDNLEDSKSEMYKIFDLLEK